MELKNLTVRDVSTLKWAVRNLRMSAKRGNAKSAYHSEEQIIDECNRLDDIISKVLSEYYENY